MQIAPLTMFDSFSRTTGTGWGTTDSGHAWNSSGLVTNLITTVDGSRGKISVSANSARHNMTLGLGSTPKQGTNEIIIRVRWYQDAQNFGWTATDFGPVLNNTDNKDFYALSLKGDFSEVAVVAYSDGIRYELARSSIQIEDFVDHWVYLRVTDKVYGKVWKVGTSEPTGWSIVSNLWNGPKRIAAGAPGFVCHGTKVAHNIEVTHMYYRTLEDTYPNVYPYDDFVRGITEGWGQSTSGHLWLGATQSDPNSPLVNVSGYTVTTGAGRGILVPKAYTHYHSFLGQSFSGDMESSMTFKYSDGTGNCSIQLGLRGQLDYSLGRARSSGYALRYDMETKILSIIKRIADVSTTTLAQTTAFTFPVNVVLRTKFVIVGTTLKGKIWQDGSVEPSTWQITASDSLYTSGMLFIYVFQELEVVPARTLEILDIGMKPPPPEAAVINTTKPISLISVSPTDTSATLQYTYQNDENNNATFFVRRKEGESTVWGPEISVAPNRVNKTVDFTLTGLEVGKSQNVQVRAVDPDGVLQPNPLSITLTTTETGVQAEAIRISSVSATAATVVAEYTRDTNNSSTASLQYRQSTEANYTITNTFVDDRDGTLLQNAGSGWNKRIGFSGDTQAVVSYGRIYPETRSETDRVLYYHTTLPQTAEYTIEFSLYTAEMAGYVGVTAQSSTVGSNENYYAAGLNASQGRWELFKMVSGTQTMLGTAPFTGEGERIYNTRFVIRSGYKALVVDGREVIRTTDASVSGPSVGYYAGGVVNGKVTNQVVLDEFSLSHRTAGGSWISLGSMTADRTAKTFTKAVTGLAIDTVYEFLVTIQDAQGIYGPSQMSITAMTTGQAMFLSSVGAKSHQTSVELDVFYDYDSNNDSYLSVQYKSIMETLWTTVTYSRIVANRTSKKFGVTIDGLRPWTTYEVKVFAFDPDGLLEKSPSFLTGVFTTLGADTGDKTRGKHYMWKVYDPNDRYIGTLQHSPEPIFSLHENGGTTDLGFTLPVKINDVGPGTFIDFQHRVDVWSIDPSSAGMGENLISDPDCDASVGGWVVGGPDFGQNASYVSDGGPDGSSALKLVSSANVVYDTISNPIELRTRSPLVIECVARAIGSSLRLFIRAYDRFDNGLDTSDDIAETVGIEWQRLRIQYQPPAKTSYVRVFIRNTGRGTMWADKFSVKSKEILVYRGRIESFTPKVNDAGEKVDVQVLGLASLLSDDYIEFLQFVEQQPQKDAQRQRPNNGAADPADMMRRVVNMAARQNSKFKLYYTSESIRATGTLAQYTFRDQQIRSCLDKIRTLCPSGWHYFISADGLVTLRGPEHAQTHYLRLGVEILEFQVEKSIRNLKNYVRVKGRQDEDENEPDGFGSINYITFDQESINKYGKRTLFIRDAQLTDPDTAKLMGDGRLDEVNREEQRATCKIPDEKAFTNVTGSLIGYNIESFQPGDNIVVVDPVGGPRASYWDRIVWDRDNWDMSNDFRPLPTPVPIKTIEYRGDRAELALSERPPSQVGDFSRLARSLANRDRES
jgi:hypothetical protein